MKLQTFPVESCKLVFPVSHLDPNICQNRCKPVRNLPAIDGSLFKGDYSIRVQTTAWEKYEDLIFTCTIIVNTPQKGLMYLSSSGMNDSRPE